MDVNLDQNNNTQVFSVVKSHFNEVHDNRGRLVIRPLLYNHRGQLLSEDSIHYNAANQFHSRNKSE